MKTIKNPLTLISIILFINSSIFSHSLDSTIQNDNKRNFYFSFNFIGYPEIVAVGVGYQPANEWSFTSKVSLASRDQEVFALSGIGIRTTRFFSTILLFNNINIQPTVMLLTRKGDVYQFGLNGLSFEIGIGNEYIKESELNFFWSVGGTISTIKKDKPKYYPSLKLGLNINFN